MPKVTAKLPLLIVKQEYVFPGFSKQLNIGRPHSLEAVFNATHSFDNKLILISEKDVSQPTISFENIFKVGVLCRIQIEKKSAQTLIVNIVAQDRVIISKPVLENNCFWTEYKVWKYPKITKLELKKISLIFKTFLKNMGPNVIARFKNKIFDEESLHQFVDTLLQNYPSNNDNFKQQALETKTLLEKYVIIADYIHFKPLQKDFDKIVNQSINKRVKNRLTSQQREFYLREKLNAIREELGEGKEEENDLDKYLKLIQTKPFPESIKTRVRSEIDRLRTLPPTSAERGLLKNYLDWIMALPWYQKTVENVDLTKALAELNKNHFGLEKAKKRIIEHLAASIFSRNVSGQILCLAGPPGTGKTSLGYSIAKALGRNYVRIALGGVKDESEIRGHRRTYLGAYPGKIIQAMKKAKSINPVVLIDEIDKLSSDYRGDPSSAMLEVLDPEQNREFMDHYIEESYDLSKVLFIATANYEEYIPAPLHDRMEIINLSSYTEIEKVNIAKSYLIKRILNKLGLNRQQISFSVKAIKEIIKYYTREAGVRELERLISKICRKFIVQFLTKKSQTLKITEKNISDYLGKRIFEHTLKQKKSQIGVATGLAYTQFGGDILTIESTHFAGDGRLILTGKLGKVMQESAEIAFNYIRANVKKYHIKENFFLKHNFHIHIPEGAIPKDGPSAGVTLITSLISLLIKKPVSRNVAMTGEVTLQGKILPIGGLKEKSISAVRSGIKQIFIPAENAKDLDEVPSEIKKKLKIVLVSEYREIFNKIFS